MSIEVTKIPKEPQWEDIVIDDHKSFNWFWMSQIWLNDIKLVSARLHNNLNAEWQRIFNLSAPQNVGDVLSMGNPIPALVGDAPFSFNDTVQGTSSITFVKVKETRIWRPGDYRIRFDMRSTIDGQWVWGIVRRNGIDVGTERSTEFHTWMTFTQDIGGWSAGDFVQVYARASGVNHVEVQRLRLYIHESDMTEAIL